MKKFILIPILFSIAVFAVSCSSADSADSVIPKVARPVSVYVFADKSKSVEFNADDVKGKAEEKMAEALNLLTNENDRIALYYIHGNTTGAGEDAAYSFPGIELPENPSTIEKNNAIESFSEQVKMEKSAFLDGFRKRLTAANSTGTEMGTDIIGILQVVSTICDPSRQNEILIFSDGVQTSNGLGNDGLSSPQAAAELARQHVKRLEEKYVIDKSKLANAKATLVLPYSPMGSRHNSNLNEYWTVLFNEFGVDVTFE